MSQQQTVIHIPIKGKKPRPVNPPILAKEDWCDFRIDYETGLTIKEIAAKYICDPRTVKKCIAQNRSSHNLGKQYAPTLLAPFVNRIEFLYQQLTEQPDPTIPAPGICRISVVITEALKEDGYQGSERTVRNYLRAKYQVISKKRN